MPRTPASAGAKAYGKKGLDAYDDISCQEDVSYIHSLFGDNTEGKKDVESSKKLNTEGCDGISILYIDLEHDDKIEVEG